MLTIVPAVYEVARRLLAAEASADGVYPREPVAAPPLVTTPWLARVIAVAGLDATSTLLLRVLVAAELERGVHRVIRRLAASDRVDGTPIDGVLGVVEGLGADPLVALQALRPSAPLIARGLVELLGSEAPPFAQRVTVPPDVVDFLAGGRPSGVAAPFALEPALPLASLCPLPVRGARDADAAEHVRRAFGSLAVAPLWLVGPTGAGRRTLLAAVAAELGANLVTVAQRDLFARGAPLSLARLWREALVHDALVCVHDAEAVHDASAPDDNVPTARIDRELVWFSEAAFAARLPVVFSSTQPPPAHAFAHPVQVIELGAVRPADALALWTRALPDVAEVGDLSARFRMPPGRIVRALDGARAAAAIHGRAPTALDVTRAISTGVAQQVSLLGTRVEDTQTWDDIILPADTREAVRELIARVRHRHQVLDQWGFRGKLSKGLGVAALFHGPPGTGKTMVASLIAKELDLTLYQVDLSRMVSKWIGETEKNLAKVFDAAEGANVMLLFDEADSLFSKRTEVKSSNDRHSNAEINYLLQRVERFEGVCVLTTNLEKSIDQAFKRRLAFRIEFPLPDERERAELWRRMVPSNAKLADDIDYDELAHAYELAGGNIRNALLRAAFLAADGREPITMALLQRAVKLEYRDAGKLGTSGAIYD